MGIPETTARQTSNEACQCMLSMSVHQREPLGYLHVQLFSKCGMRSRVTDTRKEKLVCLLLII